MCSQREAIEMKKKHSYNEKNIIYGGMYMKQVIIYFANWNLGKKKAMEGGEVASIPWEKISSVNHAFWSVTPADGTTETTFAWRKKGFAPRKEFKIVSMHPDLDYEDERPSEIDASMLGNHFAQYKIYAEKYPNVDIMLSIGGWTRCGYFSEMAYTKEGRTSCIASCIELIQTYPWISGIDIDWEYPTGSRGEERLSAGEDDEGCPVWGSAKEDNANFKAFIGELRLALDEAFGVGKKKLTACAGASVEQVLQHQEWAKVAKNLNTINLMTYDLVGVWDGKAGHTSSLTGVKKAVEYLESQGIAAEKICIGTPLYASLFLLKDGKTQTPLGAAVENYKPTQAEVTITQLRVAEIEAINEQNGWKYFYDKKAEAPYMYNKDFDAAYYRWFVSYENPISLQAKLNYIKQKNLAGIIVWECSQDTLEHDMIEQMAENLL